MTTPTFSDSRYAHACIETSASWWRPDFSEPRPFPRLSRPQVLQQLDDVAGLELVLLHVGVGVLEEGGQHVALGPWERGARGPGTGAQSNPMQGEASEDKPQPRKTKGRALPSPSLWGAGADSEQGLWELAPRRVQVPTSLASESGVLTQRTPSPEMSAACRLACRPSSEAATRSGSGPPPRPGPGDRSHQGRRTHGRHAAFAVGAQGPERSARGTLRACRERAAS